MGEDDVPIDANVPVDATECDGANTFSSGGSFERSTLIGPTWGQEIEKRDGSSARPNVPFNPPVLA